MSESAAPSPAGADWIRGGSGARPAVGWSFVTEGPLTALTLARESGETFLADDAGVLAKLDRQGRIAAITRVHDPVRSLAFSDDGRYGVAVCGESTLHLFNHVLQSQWKLEVPDPVINVAMAPFGGCLLVSSADGSNRIYNTAKKRVATFETMRPLSFAQFIAAEPGIIACAEHGLIGRFTIEGRQVWTDKLWSNVGHLAIAGDASLVFLASFMHGLQVYDGDGDTVGSYVLEGTVNRAAVSFEPHRIITSTVERQLYWLDADGEVLWQCSPPDDVEALACDPLGEGVVCGLKCGRIFRLDWTRKG